MLFFSPILNFTALPGCRKMVKKLDTKRWRRNCSLLQLFTKLFKTMTLSLSLSHTYTHTHSLSLSLSSHPSFERVLSVLAYFFLSVVVLTLLFGPLCILRHFQDFFQDKQFPSMHHHYLVYFSFHIFCLVQNLIKGKN